MKEETSLVSVVFTQNPRHKENKILILSFEMALAAIEFCESLELKRKYIIANQLLRSATSVGANIREAQNAESKADFTHKMKIAAKELEETEYWLLLCKASVNYPDPDKLIELVGPIRRILDSIISSLKRAKNEKQSSTHSEI